MAYDYAFVHLQYTIPLAAILTTICYPFLTTRHYYQTTILILIAVVATIPWDSYLINYGIWTYPDEVIIGPTLFAIPLEELFFFVVQTYITSLLYLLMNKPLLHAEYLLPTHSKRTIWAHFTGQFVLLCLTGAGGVLIVRGGEGTYLGLILAWACPFALLTWSLGGGYMLQLPWTSTILPILAPTIYLWVIDELALGRGTWSIESGTKIDVRIFGSLEIEEAVFFLATNTLIVFGLGAFDNALAIIDVFPEESPAVTTQCPPFSTLVQALSLRPTQPRRERVLGIREAVSRLCRKSRSFYLASSTFSGRLRIDLILLYSYCRMADDLIDEPPEGVPANVWIDKLRKHLELVYNTTTSDQAIHQYITTEFPSSAHSALTLLPTHILPSAPLYKLLDGFETDARFTKQGASIINNETDLEIYASQVAGTVGALCLALISHHHPYQGAAGLHNKEVSHAAERMGIALQYINIARDVSVDAAIGRVYIPLSWLKKLGETETASTQAVIKDPTSFVVERARDLLLAKAFEIYRTSRSSMNWLPAEARRPMIVAVESYMEIGRVLAERKHGVKMVRGRATVPKSRRLRVALQALLDG